MIPRFAVLLVEDDPLLMVETPDLAEAIQKMERHAAIRVILPIDAECWLRRTYGEGDEG